MSHYRCQIQGRLSLLVLHGGISSMGQQQSAELSSSFLRRFVERSKSPLIRGIDTRVVLDQQGGYVHMLDTGVVVQISRHVSGSQHKISCFWETARDPLICLWDLTKQNHKAFIQHVFHDAFSRTTLTKNEHRSMDERQKFTNMHWFFQESSFNSDNSHWGYWIEIAKILRA